MNRLYMGIMSGTSLDGIDISLCEISNSKCKEVYSKEYTFDEAIKFDVLNAISTTVTLKQLGELNYRLGLQYSLVIDNFLDDFKVDKTNIKAIGLHGQTLWHEPNTKFPFSMQLGDASLVSKYVEIDVVSDFRSADIALDGQGAPLTPAFHKLMFSHIGVKSAVLNLGGIANITILSDKTIGYDIAPANILLDAWIYKIKNKKYDAEGMWASGGSIDEKLLSKMLDEPFFKKDFPKSTGRELFNMEWLENKLDLKVYNTQDVQRTLVELLVMCTKKEVQTHKIEQLILCGGGAHNSFVKYRLEEAIGIDVKISDDFGVNSDSLEAMAFAWLAYKRVHLEKVDLKDVTGARKNAILGALYAKG